MSEKTGLELTREVVKRILEDMKKAGGTMTVDELYSGIDEREAFEKWAKSEDMRIGSDEDGYISANTTAAAMAWQARAALAATPVADAQVPQGSYVSTSGELKPDVSVYSTAAATQSDHVEQQLKMVATPAEESTTCSMVPSQVRVAATPVVLPEPVAWTLQSELDAKRTTTSGHLWFSNPVNCCWTPLYTEQQVRALLATGGQGKAVDIAELVTGMSVSVDVSTGDHDAFNRYFGTVTEVQEDSTSKHGLTLLVWDAKPNFTSQQAEDKDAVIYTYKKQPTDNVIAWRFGEACANAKPGGDYIDRGLSLLQQLQEKGYGITAIAAAKGE